MTVVNSNLAVWILPCALFFTVPALAHHSYADYDRDERSVFAGTITDIYWGNPHILLTVNDGQQDMRIEWITTTGAEVTSVPNSQFSIGAHIVVTGSKNRNPDLHVMTLIKTLEMPDLDWQWVNPSNRNK